MKVKILVPFTDKHTGKKYKKNDIVDFTAQRINEFLDAERGRWIRLVANDTTAKEVKENKEDKEK